MSYWWHAAAQQAAQAPPAPAGAFNRPYTPYVRPANATKEYTPQAWTRKSFAMQQYMALRDAGKNKGDAAITFDAYDFGLMDAEVNRMWWAMVSMLMKTVPAMREMMRFISKYYETTPRAWLGAMLRRKWVDVGHIYAEGNAATLYREILAAYEYGRMEISQPNPTPEQLAQMKAERAAMAQEGYRLSSSKNKRAEYERQGRLQRARQQQQLWRQRARQAPYRPAALEDEDDEEDRYYRRRRSGLSHEEALDE